MKLSRKVLISSFLTLMTVFAFAQEKQVQKKDSNAKSEDETSVESEYLNDIDGDIISTLADSDEYDNKLVALQYLQAAIEDGNTSDAVLQALDKLSGEGLTNQSRTNGRLSNNFPEIRRQACLLMAKVPTQHSVNTLVNIAVADSEPMVIAAAVKSLGEIGLNENDEVVDAIAYANRRNQILNPTSSLAFEVLSAYEVLADNTENKKTMIDSIARISTNYRYNTAVRTKAYKLLKDLSSSSSDDSKKKSNSKSSSSDSTEVTGD